MGNRFDSKTFEFFVQRSKTWGYPEVLFLYELLLVAVTHFCRVSESGQKPQQLLCLPLLLSPWWPGSYIQYMLDSLILFSTIIAGSTLWGFALTGTMENHSLKQGGGWEISSSSAVKRCFKSFACCRSSRLKIHLHVALTGSDVMVKISAENSIYPRKMSGILQTYPSFYLWTW